MYSKIQSLIPPFHPQFLHFYSLKLILLLVFLFSSSLFLGLNDLFLEVGLIMVLEGYD